MPLLHALRCALVELNAVVGLGPNGVALKERRQGRKLAGWGENDKAESNVVVGPGTATKRSWRRKRRWAAGAWRILAGEVGVCDRE